MSVAGPKPKLSLVSLGWSEYPDHAEDLQCFLFDIEQIGHDIEIIGAQWQHFGGTGGSIDAQLAQAEYVPQLERLLQILLDEVAALLRRGADIPPITIAILCAWGKHRSRRLVAKLAEWFSQKYPSLSSDFHVSHLSEPNRKRELRHFQDCRERRMEYRDAIKSAKQMGTRRKRWEFDRIKKQACWNLCAAIMQHYYIDIEWYKPNDELLQWCLGLLPYGQIADAHMADPDVASASSLQAHAHMPDLGAEPESSPELHAPMQDSDAESESSKASRTGPYAGSDSVSSDDAE